MKKIISLFQRNYDTDRLVRDEVTPGAEWVVNGEGFATRKWDGLAVMHRDGQWFKRYDAKTFTMDNGKRRNYNRQPPEGFEPLQDPDPITGHWPGWIPCSPDNPADKLLYDTVAEYASVVWENGSYELIGPKIGTRGGANPEKLQEHQIVPHGRGNAFYPYAPRTFDELKEWFKDVDIEGLVWHHDDGRMVKIKKKDFGYKR
jgi:hypothetical protein